MDFYNNWIDMQGADFQGQYYGRHLLQDLDLPVPSQWTCVELMVAMNSPASASNGELAVWIDGAEVANFRPGAPNGSWDGSGNWRMGGGSSFSGFRWRDTASLGLNWVKLQNYNAVPRVWFDDVVVSTERVGCHGQQVTPMPPGTGDDLVLAAQASVDGTDVTVTATVEGGSGPYYFLFDCTDDGNWDSPIPPATNQTTLQHSCEYGAAGTYDVLTQVWDQGSGVVLQELLSVTVEDSTPVQPVQLGMPGRPQLVLP